MGLECWVPLAAAFKCCSFLQAFFPAMWLRWAVKGPCLPGSAQHEGAVLLHTGPADLVRGQAPGNGHPASLPKRV